MIRPEHETEHRIPTAYPGRSSWWLVAAGVLLVLGLRAASIF